MRIKKPATRLEEKALKKVVRKNVHMKYLLCLPKGYAGRKRWPLVLFLHGAGERGDNLAMVKVHGPAKLAEAGKEFPFIIVAPQCPNDRWWNQEIEPLQLLLDNVCRRYAVDADRIYVTGLSMGGFGTWALAIDQPGRFAAIAPICGGSIPLLASGIAHIPTWVFHGGKDSVVPLSYSREMVDALRAAGAKPKFTVYPKAGHDSWTATYDNPEFYRWMLKQKRR